MADTPLVGVIMGSDSDWPQMKKCVDILKRLGIPYKCQVLSAHRMTEEMNEYARTAIERGLKIVIAGAGGAAHLPGMVASQTLLPVIGVPILASSTAGLDSLLSIAQMPAGSPVATMGVNSGGPANAALLAARILSLSDPELLVALEIYKGEQHAAVATNTDPEVTWEAKQATKTGGAS